MGSVKLLSVPRLQSERLILESLSRRHSDGMYALWSCPEVCRYSGPAEDPDGGPITLPARSPADSDKIIDFFARGRAAGTRFRWAVLTRDGGAFIGAAGFNALGRCAEVAFHLRPEFWGRGLMQEAVQEAIRWLQAEVGSEAVEAFIAPANHRSIRLATRLGMAPTGQSVDGADRYLVKLAPAGPAGGGRTDKA